MGKHRSSDYKLSAVKYYLKMKEPSYRKVCEIFECSKDSLVRWLKRYLETGTVDNKERSKGSYKVKQKHVDYILKLIKNKPTITLHDILANFHEKYKDITISKSHLVNIIKFANLTYKKVQHTHKPDTRYSKPIDYDEEYKKFYSKLKKYDINDIISIDETSLNIGMSKMKGRKEIGKRLEKVTKDNIVFVKHTLIMAITTKGVIGWTLYKKGGIDHERLIEFLKSILDKRKNKLVLMDNASSHRNPKVKEFIKNSKNDYIHTLPYHHYLNPIEKLFNQLKHYMKQDEPMSFDDLGKSIKKTIKKISNDNLMNYFTSSLKKTKKDIEESKTKYHKEPKIYKK